MNSNLQSVIDEAWEQRDSIGPNTGGDVRLAVERAIAALDRGEARIA
jgi:2,3,4,5-tetrahydropyridine-2-carboxylate N-succinyltransferase